MKDMFQCNCKDPAEHAQHLAGEKAVFGKMFEEPLRYYLRDGDGVEREVSREEFFASLADFGSHSDSGTEWTDC